MRIKNDNAAGAPGGYSWEAGESVEIEDEAFAAELIAIPDGGFYHDDGHPAPKKPRSKPVKKDQGDVKISEFPEVDSEIPVPEVEEAPELTEVAEAPEAEVAPAEYDLPA